MNQTFTLDTGWGVTLIILLGSVVGIVFLAVSIFRGWVAIKKCRKIVKPADTADDWQVVEKFAFRQVLTRVFLFVMTFILFGLLWQNAYVYFRTIQISDSSFRLVYLCRGDNLLMRDRVASVTIVHERGGGHLEITMESGDSFRSVLVKDISILDRIESLTH